MNKFSFVSPDYSKTTSNFEKWVIVKILTFFIEDIPVALDFLDGHVINLGNDNPNYIIAPSRLWRLVRTFINPSLYIGEDFIRGKWFCVKGELSELIILFSSRNKKKFKYKGLAMGVTQFLKSFYKQSIRPKTKPRETKHHYNIDSRIYKKIIGEEMVYSCAFFNDDSETLKDAQNNKLSVTLERLDIGKNQEKILDIGCGWGSFLFYAVKQNNAIYHGISIAKSQIDYANQIKTTIDKKLSKRLLFLCSDFINFRIEESDIYDKIVSIGMLEHVGKNQYPCYFSEISRLLKENGKAVIHSIVRKDRGASNEWIDKHIFPGGYIPRSSEIVSGIEASNLKIESIFFHRGKNYKKTLIHWSNNLINNYDKCFDYFFSLYKEENVYDTVNIRQNCRKTLRIWYFYLSAIQSIFDSRCGGYDVCQLIIYKPSPKG